MKTIGFLGGMSWESTVTYYQIANRVVGARLGGLHSAKCLLASLDLEEIASLQHSGQWDKSGEILADAALKLQLAGADFVVLCTNTMHKVADKIASRLSIPLLHIADATADVLKQNNITKVALLGSIYTMEQDFYKNKLHEHNIEVIVPNPEDRRFVSDVIYNELCLGKICQSSKTRYLEIIEKLYKNGAQGAILGCTEIGLLVQQENTFVPLFDTALIHAQKAAEKALED